MNTSTQKFVDIVRCYFKNFTEKKMDIYDLMGNLDALYSASEEVDEKVLAGIAELINDLDNQIIARPYEEMRLRKSDEQDYKIVSKKIAKLEPKILADRISIDLTKTSENESTVTYSFEMEVYELINKVYEVDMKYGQCAFNKITNKFSLVEDSTDPYYFENPLEVGAIKSQLLLCKKNKEYPKALWITRENINFEEG